MNGISILSFIFFVGFLAFLSWYKSRKGRVRVNTLNGLFLANRSLSFLFVGGGLLLANINTATIIGENELVYTNNMTVMAWGMTSVVAMLIVSEFIIPIYLRTGIATTPDYLKARYDRQTGAIVSFIFLVSYVVNLLPSVLYASAVAFNGLFRLSDVFQTDYWTTIWILVWVMGTVGCLYAILGGMKAIAISDSLLGLGMFGGCMLIPFLGLKYLGHGSIVNGLHLLLSSRTGHLNSIGTASDAIPFSTLFTGMLLVNLYYWGTEQYIVQQVLASKDLESSQKGIAVACAGKIISPLLLNVPGLIAIHLFSHMSNTAEVFPKLDRLVSPPFVAGYIAAIIFSAGLSTFNAGLNSSSTLFMLNVYKPRLQKRGREIDEAHLVRVAKRFEILVCLTAMFIAPFIIFAKRGFYTYVQTVNGFFNVPIFTIIFIGFVTKRVPPVAAKAGLIFFIVAYGLTQLVFPTGIHFLHVLALLFLLTSLIMLIIGKLFPMAVPYRQQLNNFVSIEPWKNRHFFSVLLVILMILMFALFSPIGLAK
jgi:SSS family solute:Na+ symporter